MYPERVAKALQRAKAYIQSGNAELALPELEKAVQKAPKGFEAWFLLGQAKGMLGDYAGSEIALKKAVPHNPKHADAWYIMGISLSARGQYEQALECYHKAIVNSAHLHVHATHNFGSCLIALEQYEEAAGVLGGLARHFENADIVALHGIALQGMGDFDAAIAAYERAMALGMDNFTLNVNLGECHYAKGDFQKAVQYGERALQIKPGDSVANLNIAKSYLEMGEVARAIEMFAKNASQATENARLFALNFVEPFDPKASLDEHVAWAQRTEARTPQLPVLEVDRAPDRPLRLGFVSADLREHPVTFFLENLVAQINRDQFKLFFYSDVRGEDEITARFKQHADGWHDTAKLTGNAAVAELVRKDGIDILFDLGGHTSERVAMFAGRVAPVQASYLGYAATTGLSNMDYFVTDTVLDPAGMTEAHYTEKLCRLGDAFVSYRTPASEVQPGALPMLKNGAPTFASFHRLNKISPNTVALWSQALQAVPNAKMLLAGKGFGTESGCKRVLDAFASHGIDAARLEFRGNLPMDEYLALHNEIDLILDCFPWNSHTTAMHALWMGVPTLTVAGSHHAGRFGELILRGMDMPQFIAPSAEEFASTAAGLVAAPEHLQSLREATRNRLAYSVLCNHTLLASRFQKACRQMWKNYLDGAAADITVQ